MACAKYENGIDGECGSEVNTCLSGDFEDLPDTNTTYEWMCFGENGGKDDLCSKVIQETYNWSCQEETKGTCRNRTKEECKKFAGRAEDRICWSRGGIRNNGIESLGWIFKVDDDACGYCGSRYFYNVQSQGSSNPIQEHYPAIGNDLPLKPGCPELEGKIDVAACLGQSDACVAADLEIVESSSKQKLCLDSNGNAVHERFCANAKDISCAEYEPKTFKATFKANGAQTQNGSTYTTSPVTKECSGQTGCNVTAPNIKRAGFNIIGWSNSPNATIASVKTGDSITLSGNVTYYAITDKTVTGTFVKGAGVSSVSKISDTCMIRNSATSCDISPMPTVTCQTNHNDPTWNPSHLNGLTDNATSTATCKSIPQADPKCGSYRGACAEGTSSNTKPEILLYKNPKDGWNAHSEWQCNLGNLSVGCEQYYNYNVGDCPQTYERDESKNACVPKAKYCARVLYSSQLNGGITRRTGNGRCFGNEYMDGINNSYSNGIDFRNYTFVSMNTDGTFGEQHVDDVVGRYGNIKMVEYNPINVDLCHPVEERVYSVRGSEEFIDNECSLNPLGWPQDDGYYLTCGTKNNLTAEKCPGTIINSSNVVQKP